MQIISYANLHKINRLVRLKNELSEIYLNQLIQTFAISLIGIFIPIYLLEIGYDLFMVLNYFAIFSLGIIVFAPLTAKISTKIGLKHTILISTIPLIVQYILLQILGHVKSFQLFYTIPVIQGLWASLYWLPLHSEFVKNSHKVHEGSEIGNLLALPKLAATFAPFFGALILKSLGFDVLFILVIALVILSVGPLFMTSDSKKRFHFRIKDIFLIYKKRIHLYLFAEGIYFTIEVILWPIFVFFLFKDIMTIGILATISSLGIIIFTFIISKFANQAANKTKIMQIGGILYGIILVLRAFVTNLNEVYILSFLGGMFSTMIMISIYAKFCDEARSRNIIAASISRHLWIGIGRLIPLILVYYLFGIELSFIIFGLSIILLLFV